MLVQIGSGVELKWITNVSFRAQKHISVSHKPKHISVVACVIFPSISFLSAPPISCLSSTPVCCLAVSQSGAEGVPEHAEGAGKSHKTAGSAQVRLTWIRVAMETRHTLQP